MLNKYIFILAVILFFAGCNKSTKGNFSIPFIKKEIMVDAILAETCWNEGALVKNLISPWENQGVDQTTFKAFVSKEYFNFSFEVIDSTIILFPFEEELTVANEDRVELFFSSDTTLNNYYCIEMDPNGNVLDYSAKFYREFDEGWNFKSSEIVAVITEQGYLIEGRISLDELDSLGIAGEFFLGIFRADFKSQMTDDVIWFSWIKPKSPEPDFNIPSSFEKVRLTNN